MFVGGIGSEEIFTKVIWSPFPSTRSWHWIFRTSAASFQPSQWWSYALSERM